MVFQKGHPSYLTKESKKKISETLKGRPSWCKGKKLSKEIIAKRKNSPKKIINCKNCGNEFPRTSNRRIFCCKKCERESYKNKARHNYNQYIIRHPGKKGLSGKISRLKRKFNLTLKEYEQLLNAQNNKCKICLIVLNTEINNNNWAKKACVDHNHQTGAIRGILCSSCNHGLGSFKDDINLLIKAKEYLEKKI